ncbi:hypothetical protein BGZ65_009058 [Modicella reniformis]|uniref:Galactose oxidase n=1 Tax=Modicella reniformis TaxID=1440133 RepID=A0A9P6LRQ8_9FUNG|nr:hypothetical protein BGZ65_009058 [Modicella reniformis]
MPQAISSSFFIVFILLTHILTLQLIISFTDSSSSVHAQQTFRPIPVNGSCSTFVEQEGLYVIGGSSSDAAPVAQSFMLDLSVSWNTSDPVFKKLTDAPAPGVMTCAVTSNGQQLFTQGEGTAHIYNIKSASWESLSGINFNPGLRTAAVTNPVSGVIYVPNGGKTETIDMAPNFNETRYFTAAWSVLLQGMLLALPKMDSIYTFTPGTGNPGDSMKGRWDTRATGGDIPFPRNMSCLVPAYDGSKIILFGGSDDSDKKLYSSIYLLDVATMNWTRGADSPDQFERASSACAVSGHQFIAWGGVNGKDLLNTTLVYNIKMNTWNSSYMAPSLPEPSISATITTQLTPPSETPESNNNTSSDDRILIIVIVVTTGVLLVMIVAIIFLCLRRANKLDPEDHQSSFGSQNVKCGINICDKVVLPRPRNPAKISPVEQRSCVFSKNNRLHQGSVGARPLSEHPHAIIEEEEEENSLIDRDEQRASSRACRSPQHPQTSSDHDTSHLTYLDLNTVHDHSSLDYQVENNSNS